MNKLKGWDEQHCGDVSKCWNEVMDHWIRSGGTHDYPVTWDSLYTLLVNVQLAPVAMKLKEAVSKCPPQLPN